MQYKDESGFKGSCVCGGGGVMYEDLMLLLAVVLNAISGWIYMSAGYYKIARFNLAIALALFGYWVGRSM